MPSADPGSRLSYVIIGAGLAGASVAWHLRRRGIEDVLLLERESMPGVHSSGRNAAIVRVNQETPGLDALARESATALRTGELAGFRATGGVLLGAGDTPAGDLVAGAEGRGAFQAEDGIVDVAALLRSYLRGQTVRTDTEVTGLEPETGGLRVTTTTGTLHARVVVNAAGAWAGRLGALPLSPTNRHLFISTRRPGIDPQGPYLWDDAAGYYLRPESGGLLLCACDESPAEPGVTPEDPAVLDQLAAKLRMHQPGLADTRILRSWVGQRTFAADRKPVVGFDPRIPRLFHMAAFGGSGVTLSYAAGRMAADLLLGTPDVSDPTLALVRPERFVCAAPVASRGAPDA